jgi:hypothetical protein
MTQLQVTSAQEFRKKTEELKEGKIVTLPSGNVVKLCKPSITSMLKNGLVPNRLLSVALGSKTDTTQLTPEDLKKGMELIDFIIMQAFVEPKMVEKDPQDNEITIDDLTDEDRTFVQTYAQGGASDLNSFRNE